MKSKILGLIFVLILANAHSQIISNEAFSLSNTFGDLQMRRYAAGDTTFKRALVPNATTLDVNYAGDFSNGVRIQGSKLRVDGNLGVGTSTPNHRLTVEGGASPNIELKNSNYSNGGFVINRTNYGHQWKWWAESNVMYFGFSTDETNYANKLVIESNGNIGIGTPNPNYSLDVNSSDFVVSKFSRLGAGGGAVIKMENAGNSGSWQFGVGSHKHFGIYKSSEADFGQQLIILENGNIGINTITPDEKLSVNGNIHTKEVRVDLIGWSDFVFNDDYNLPTLQEVESHIKEKGHLKDIPSAKEVAENGIFLGEMDAKLLQKIEELMLYTIEQEKRIEALEHKNEKLLSLIEKFLDEKE